MTLRSYVALGAFVLTVLAGFGTGVLPISPAAQAESERVVSLYADGQKRVFTTEAATVGDVLTRAKVVLAKGDLVEPALSAPVTNGFFNINVYRARPVQVADGAKSYEIQSAYHSPRLLADAAGIKLYPEDELKADVITDFVAADTLGVKVSVIRALPVSVRVDGKTISFRTQADTLGEALAGAGIKLGLKDTISLPLTTPVTAGLKATIIRVSEVESQQTTTIARKVQTVSDPELPKGTTKVRQEGSDGQKVALYRIHYRNGVETKRETLKLISEKAPVDKVIVVGTKVFFAGSVEYWRPLVIQAATANGIDPNMMLRIMACESGGNATAINRSTVYSPVYGHEHASGLFQFLPSTWRSAGGNDANIFDGPTQIRLTAQYMARYGTRAWACK